MKKNSLETKKYLVNILIDHKINYRETDKSIIVPFENGGNVDREPIWFKNFRIKQEAFNERQEVFNGEVRTFMKEQKEFNKNIEHKVNAILECPTIKREIKL